MPPDLCYVYNFGHARRSLPLPLLTGRGLQLKQNFDAFIVNARRRSPRLFESEEDTKHRDKVMQELEMGDRSPKACATQREVPRAIDLGTHAGVPSSHLSSVIGRWFEPSAFITNSSAYG